MWSSLLRGTVLCSSMMASVTSAKSCNSTSSSCCQVSPSALFQEKASRNKRKFRADPPLSDTSKSLSMPQIDCASYEFSAEKFEIMTGQGLAAPCDACDHKDYPDGLKLDLELSSATVASEVGPRRNKEEVEADEFQDADWSDFTESQLEELVFSNLDTIFKSAIKKIVACGYTEEVATNAVLRSGLCYGCKDIVSNIVDNTLAYLRNGVEIDHPGREQYFTDLKQLEMYVLAELVCVLREVRPFFSTGDAMWCLLICDMNVSHACAMDADPLNGFGGDGGPIASSSISNESPIRSDVKSSETTLSNSCNAVPAVPCVHNYESNEPTVGVHQNLSQPESSPLQNISGESVSNSLVTVNKSSAFAAASLAPTLEEKFVSKRVHGGSKRDYALRQKSLHLEKHYRTYGSKGSSRAAKLGSLGGLMDKKLKSMADSASKSASLKTNKAAAINVAQGNSHGSLSKSSESPSPAVFNLENASTVLEDSRTKISLNSPVAGGPSVGSELVNPPPFSATNPDLSLSLTTKCNLVPVPTSCNAERSDFNFAGIPYDRISGHWVPRDKKEELILKVVPKLHELQNQLQEWTEWANQKVMQAARRLSKDKAELKALKQEREEVERLKKEKQALEENTMKKLSEMENALCKASGQVERANSAVRRLEVENAALRQEMETAKLRAAESAANCQEVSKREKKTRMKLQSWEKEKSMLQEELVTEKHRFALLKQDVDQAKDLCHQREARWKQEEKVKEDSLVQAILLRKEREQIEASTKSKEQLTKSDAENTSQKYKEDIQRLEKEISQLRLKADSSKIAALWRGIDGSYASMLSNPGKGLHNMPQDSPMPEGVDFQEYMGVGVRRERECVMCLSEEMSVVFLPCAHQVVCSTCNELHERQGMKDCPSCRSHIQQRISVRFPPARS